MLRDGPGRPTPVWLVAEDEAPADAVRSFEFIARGAAPACSAFYVLPWHEAMGLRPIVTYDDIVPRNDFGRHVRRLELEARRAELREQRRREAEERYARIPPRRKRRHDGA